VSYWSDFLKVHLHPRTVHTLTRVATTAPFDCYNEGEHIFKVDCAVEDALDAARHFQEECDLIQGFHVFVDTNSAWSGVASSVLEYLRDDFKSTPILTLGNSPQLADEVHTPGGKQRRAVTEAIGISKLAEYSSCFVPLSSRNFHGQDHPSVCLPSTSHYNTSAVVAAAVDTTTLIYRLKDARCSMSDVLQTLSAATTMEIATLGSLMPFDSPGLVIRTLEDAFPNGAGAPYSLTSFAPPCTVDYSEFSALSWDQMQDSEIVSLRGMSPSDFGEACASPSNDAMLQKQLDLCYRCRARRTAFIRDPLLLPVCHPQVYRDNLLWRQAATAASEATPEPQPELQQTVPLDRDTQPLLSLATRLTNSASECLPFIHSTKDTIRTAFARPSADAMAAAGGANIEGTTMLREIEEAYASMIGDLLQRADRQEEAGGSSSDDGFDDDENT
jgi:hypothetical protein